MEVEAQSRHLSASERLSQFFKLHWRGFVVGLSPIIFLPIAFQGTSAYHCLYILLIMAVYWVSEALPLPVTSMIPIVAFPLFGILDSETTCKLYFKDTLVMFMGGIMIALSVEHCNLHKRLALKVIQIVGCSPRRLHFGLIMTTTFISIWISNAAATSMMCPIIFAILEELQNQGLCKMYREDDYKLVGKKDDDEPKGPSKMAICFYMGIAYAASIGGCGSLIGTGTNLTFKGIYDTTFPTATDTIDFGSFIIYSLPIVVLTSCLMYVYLQWLYMGLFRPKSKEAQDANIGEEGARVARNVVDQRYNELGPMSSHEIGVMILFILMVVLYFTRHPGFMPGWDSLFPNGKAIKNSLPTILVVILLFVLPANWAFMRFCCGSSKDQYPEKEIPSMTNWKFLQQRVPWGLIFLIGGGFALAEGSKKSGMADMISESLLFLQPLPKPVILFIVILIAEFLTAFSSNVAIANIIIPVLAQLALKIEIHPLFLILPAGLACSMAFHLPVSTPPNAIVAGYANVKSKDMAIAGIGATVGSIVVLYLCCQLWGVLIYPDLNSFPQWALDSIIKVNSTGH